MVVKYIKIIFYTLFISALTASAILYKKVWHLRANLDILALNQKAFIAENSSLKEQGRIFKFTIEQLGYYNDSVLQEMNKVRRELKVKDKSLQQLQYLLSVSTKKRHSTFYRYNI